MAVDRECSKCGKIKIIEGIVPGTVCRECLSLGAKMEFRVKLNRVDTDKNIEVMVTIDLPDDCKDDPQVNPKTVASTKAKIAVCDMAGIVYDPTIMKVSSVEEVNKD